LNVVLVSVVSLRYWEKIAAVFKCLKQVSVTASWDLPKVARNVRLDRKSSLEAYVVTNWIPKSQKRPTFRGRAKNIVL